MSGTRTMVATQVRVEQRIFWRNSSVVFFTFVFPLLLLGFLGAFSDPEVLVPGVAALVLVSTAFQSLAISIAFHREQGILKRLMSTPLTPTALVAGKVLSIAMVAVAELVLVVAAGVLFYDLALPARPAAFAAIALLGIATFAALGIALASIIPSGEAAPAVTNAVYLPMMFVSAVFYPLSALPEPLQLLGRVLPLFHLVEPLRQAWLGAAATTATMVSLAVLAAWGVAGVVCAVTRFRWEPSHER